jgi:cobalt-zinc-cadmium resistance protein CzcA
MKLIEFFVRQRLLTVLIVLAVLGSGIWAWRSLPIDAFPDVTNIQVMVLSRAPGLNTSEVERRISYPIELAMTGLPLVTDVRSLSKNGLSQVRILFEEGTDIYFARQLVHERLSAAKESLPEGVEAEMGPISTGLGEIYQYTLEAGHTCPDHPQVWSPDPGQCPEDGRELVPPTLDATQLRTLQDWEVAARMKGVKGVNEVNSFGGFVKQFQVEPNPDLLMKYDLSLRAVVAAVAENNANQGGGFVVSGDEQHFVVAKGLVRNQADLERIVLKTEHGAPILVRDVAKVSAGTMTRMGAVTRDGRGEVVAGMVIMLKGENSREVVDRVKQRMADIQRSLPPQVKVRPFYDRTDLIQASVHTITTALLEGGFFVLLVLLLFLWDLRSALVVALSLPLTAALSFLTMGTVGITANLMTLGGLAIAIGMVVDGTIVVVENIVGMLRDPANARLSRREVALAATREVARPVFFSILVIVLVLIPLFTLEQIEGKMFKPMAATIIIAMASSLLVALTVVPSLTAALSSRRPEKRGGNPVVRSLLRIYEPSLRFALRHRLAMALISLAFLVGAGLLIPRLGTEFLPPLDEGAFAVNVVRLPSASLDASKNQATVLERQILEAFPEVWTVVSKTGRPVIAEDPMGPEQNDLIIMLRPKEEWRVGMTRPRLIAGLESIFEAMPGVRPSFSQPIALRVNELISGVKSDVAVKIYGDDIDRLREEAHKVAAQLRGVPGAQDVAVEQTSGLSEIQVVPDWGQLARHGLNISDVNEIVGTAVGGTVVGHLYEGQRWSGIQVRYPESARSSKEAIERIPMESATGSRLFLGDVARVTYVETPAQVSRDNSRRRLLVECNVRGRDLGSFVAEAREKLAPVEAALGEGYFMEWGGQFENQERATRRLALVVPVALVLILLVQLSALRNLRSTLLVVLNLPFSVVGGVGVIWLADMNVSVSVLVGLIALFGMAVQHGTVLVSFIDELRTRGLTIPQAVSEASLRRLRPLLMTKLTSVLGLLPILFTAGPGSDIQKPLAMVVLGGLAFTTLLNTYVVPALYPWFHRESVASPLPHADESGSA